MKLIGSGIQYKVFEANKKRVVKKLLSPVEVRAVINEWDDKSLSTNLGIIQYNIDQTIKTNSKIQKLIANYPELAIKLGKPVFENDYEYTQDKVLTLSNIINKSNKIEIDKLLSEYINLILFTWRFGFSDTVFNFTINNGINKRGDLILIDFGEVTFRKSIVEKMINNKSWQKSWSCKHDITQDLKAYFIKQMDSRLTITQLNKIWKTKLLNVGC